MFAKRFALTFAALALLLAVPAMAGAQSKTVLSRPQGATGQPLTPPGQTMEKKGPSPLIQKGQYVQTADNFIILFDSSGSMAGEYAPSKTTKLLAAEDLLRAFNADIPDFNYKAGLYTFTPWKAYYPLGSYDKAGYRQAIDSLPTEIPGGQAFGAPTPLGEAMLKVGDMLKTLSGRTVVIIFSDGRNTDTRNPVKIAKGLAAKYNVCFMTVSVAQNRDGQKMLDSIAKASPCSLNVDFDYAVRNPEVCTGQICALAPFTAIVQPSGTTYVPVHTIWFAFDKSDLRAWDKEMLDKAAADLKADPSSTFYASGYTDSIGTEKYNVGLSMRRAMAAKEYLVKKHGINPDRMVIRWFGESSPAASNETAAGRRLNRRVEYMVMPGSK
ncbi:OmpA/MotB domain protein [Desulfovibrio sp. X2]|uniref:OmpA family protein n=1 Tax=Desulfovibrio sp. X2 TaxID=941449 RepID=UPI000358CC67|nr:OmpA family protein [Desulfovibrio sp. X2]EPR44249.1 OmpA/MotB domain protein [Desulfovibrio sp. X2]